MQHLEVTIRHLYISAGHNFRNHHGSEPCTYPMNEVRLVHCEAGKGIKGDRYFGYDENYKGQISFFDWSVYHRLCNSLGICDRAPSVFRRNVIIEGTSLKDLIGEGFEIQGVQFEGAEECKPCSWMDRAFGPGACAAMEGCGGLRARILNSGVLRTAAD